MLPSWRHYFLYFAYRDHCFLQQCQSLEISKFFRTYLATFGSWTLRNCSERPSLRWNSMLLPQLRQIEAPTAPLDFRHRSIKQQERKNCEWQKCNWGRMILAIEILNLQLNGYSGSLSRLRTTIPHLSYL